MGERKDKPRKEAAQETGEGSWLHRGRPIEGGIIVATVHLEENEYKALMHRLEALEKAVGNEVGRVVPQFASLVKSKPYDRVRPIRDDVPEFKFFDYGNSDAWIAFLALAKSYLKENDRFYMGTTGHGMKYIRCVSADRVRVISKEPIEKQLLAAQMVSEMVDVYNKYFVDAHRDVIYKPSQNGDPIIVRSIYDPNEVCG